MAYLGPLAGVKVVVLGGVVTAPRMGTYLSVFGATTVRVDSHRRVDTLRFQRPHPGGIPSLNKGAWYAMVNANMLGVSVDWSKPGGRAIMHRLLRWADVVIENFSAGTLAEFGFDYATVSKDHPAVIYLSSCLMGQTGPWVSINGYGVAAASMAVVTHLTGRPEEEPQPIRTQYTDYINPKFGAAIILGALEYRRRTGKGQYLDQSQVEGGIQVVTPLIMDAVNNRHSAGRTGNQVPGAVPHSTYPCKGDDRWVAIAVFTDAQWAGLCRAMGNPPWARDQRFATLLERKRHEAELDALLGQWTRKRTPEEVETFLQREGVPSSVVEDSKTTREDAQLAHREFFRTRRHAVLGDHTYRGPSFRLSKTADLQGAGPALGEHNVQVCRMLGMDDDEIWKAMQEGALGTQPVVPVTGKVEGDSYSDTLAFLQGRIQHGAAVDRGIPHP